MGFMVICSSSKRLDVKPIFLKILFWIKSNSKFVTKIAKIVLISIIAKCYPKQILGPAQKGMNSKGFMSFKSFNLSGLNS